MSKRNEDLSISCALKEYCSISLLSFKETEKEEEENFLLFSFLDLLFLNQMLHYLFDVFFYFFFEKRGKSTYLMAQSIRLHSEYFFLKNFVGSMLLS